jgi:hypothetical protein
MIDKSSERGKQRTGFVDENELIDKKYYLGICDTLWPL